MKRNLLSHIGKMHISSTLVRLMTRRNTESSACAWRHPQANIALLGRIPKYSDLSGGKLISKNFLAP